MSVYKTKAFARFARKAGLADAQLIEAATAVIEGVLTPISVAASSSSGSLDPAAASPEDFGH